jgi:hypothetical protein
MPYTIASFVTRQSALSPTDFKNAYEAHVPFVRETVGDAAFPQEYTRQYVRRSPADPQGLKIVSFTGSEDTFGYDLVSYMKFRDEDHAKGFYQAYGEKKDKIDAKTAAFAEMSQFKIIGFEDAIVD